MQIKLQGTLGIDILMDVIGRDAQMIFALRKTAFIFSFKEDLHQLYAIQLALPSAEGFRFGLFNPDQQYLSIVVGMMLFNLRVNKRFCAAGVDVRLG